FFSKDGLTRLADAAGLAVPGQWFDRLLLARLGGGGGLATPAAGVLAPRDRPGDGRFFPFFFGTPPPPPGAGGRGVRRPPRASPAAAIESDALSRGSVARAGGAARRAGRVPAARRQ